MPGTDLTAGISLIRKKPAVHRGVLWAGGNIETVRSLTGRDHFRLPTARELREDPTMTAAVYDRLHATWVHAHNEDWIVEGTLREHYPVYGTVFPVLYDYLGPEQ